MQNIKQFFYITLLFFLLAAPIFIAVGAPPVQAQEPVSKPYSIELYSNRIGFSAYVLSFALSDLINKHSKWLRISCIETKGTVENMATLMKHPEKQRIWVGHVNPLTRHQAKIGDKPFNKPYDEIRAIGTISIATESFATLDPRIKTLQGLAGKNVMIGLRGSSPGQTFGFILQYGVGILDKVKISRGGLDASKNALIDGTVDAGWTAVNPLKQRPDGAWDSTPTPAAVELFQTKKTYMISIPRNVIKKAAKATGWPMRPLDVAGATFGKTTFGSWTGHLVSNGWYVHKSMPDEVVTEIIRIAWEYSDQFKNYHACGAAITRENLPKLAEPESDFHPAAIKWYKGHGVKKIGLD
jgi:TRAP transporter TAXI family solute receptor